MFRSQSVDASGVDGPTQKLVHFILRVCTFLGIPAKPGADIGKLTARDTVTWIAVHGHLDWPETPGRPPEEGAAGTEPRLCP